MKIRKMVCLLVAAVVLVGCGKTEKKPTTAQEQTKKEPIQYEKLSDEELKEYETELSKYDVEGSIKDFTNPIKIGDGTRTIGSCIQQFFQQVV